MSAVIIATLVVVGALAVLIVSQTRALRREIREIKGQLCGRFDSMHGELRAAADRMAYLDGYLTGAAPAIVAAATRKIQEPPESR